MTNFQSHKEQKPTATKKRCNIFIKSVKKYLGSLSRASVHKNSMARFQFAF